MVEKSKNFIYKLLRQGQKFTGTDNVYLAKQGSYLTIGNIISMVISFGLSIVFARLLPKETYGQYKYILSIFGILAISSLSGMNTAIVRGVARGFEATFKKGFLAKLKWSLFGSLASIGLAFYFLNNENSIFGISFLIIAFFLPFFKSGEAYQFYLGGKKFFGKRVTYVTISQAIAAVVLITTMLLTKSLVFLILAYFLSYSLLRLLFSIIVVKKYQPNKQDDGETVSYGKHLSLIQLLGLVANELDKILLFLFLGPIEVAVYSFALLPIQYLRGPLQTVRELALPKLSDRSNQEIKKFLPKKIIKSSVIILIIIVFYLILAPYFFKIFYPAYSDSIIYSQLLALSLLVFPASMMSLGLLAKKRTKELYQISLANSVSKIILMLLLAPSFGILGIVLAQLISQIIHFLITLYSFRRI